MYRKSTADDCFDIYHLICKLEDTELPYADFKKIYLAQTQDEQYYCLVCEQNNRLVGILNLRFEAQLHHAAKISEILEFFITEPYRNHGLGKEMFTYGCQIAQRMGCQQIEVTCNQLRTKAHRFYSRQGMDFSHYKFSKSFGKK
ncbi:MAG: GNAT family N-acetyltransferase [Eubacteriales bacterium]|nr:GNAT family N-acetyltransferase [Eubacteriales bacterium]